MIVLHQISKQSRPVRVLQFGEGNFLRAFAEDFLQQGNESGVTDLSVVIVKPRESGSVERFCRRDGIYTVAIRGQEMGIPVETERVITCVDRVLMPSQLFGAERSVYLNETLRFIISNTTEAGIALDPADEQMTELPVSFPAKLTKLLYERYCHFSGDLQRGLLMLPCELIEENGRKLKACVLEQARRWNLEPAFAEWVGTACSFADTLVDRIVSGYPAGQIDTFTQKLGYADDLLVVAEPYGLWAVEGDERLRNELPLNRAVPQVCYVEDVRPYRERKVRILNGCHTALVPVALLSGRQLVRQCMEDTALSGYLDRLMGEEVIPCLTCLPREELGDFYRAVRDRFANPYLDHSLEAISLNSVSKWNTRVAPSVMAYWEAKGSLPALLTFSLASELAFLSSWGNVKDLPAVTDFLQRHRNDEPSELVRAAAAELLDRPVAELPGLISEVTHCLERIREAGMAQALAERMEGRL